MREKTVYTDGRKVTVTGYSLRVGKRLYPFDDITKYGIVKIKPNRFPSIVVMILGAGVVAVEYFKVIPPNILYWVPSEVAVYDYKFSQGDLVMGAGALLFTLGLISLVALPVRYGVRVVNAVGDINAVITRRRKYAEKIVEAIDEGLRRNRDEARKMEEPSRTVRREIV